MTRVTLSGSRDYIRAELAAAVASKPGVTLKEWIEHMRRARENGGK